MGDQKTNQDSERESKSKWYDWRPPDWVRHAAEIVALLFFVVVDARDIWPDSHILAVPAGVVVSGILFIAELPLGWGLAAIAATLLLGLGIYAAGPPETEKFEILQPLELAPPNTVPTKEVTGWLERERSQQV